MPITVLTAAEIKNLDHMCPYAEDMQMGTVIGALITASNGSTTYAGPAVTDAMVANFDEKACPNWDAKNGNVEIAGILKDLIDGDCRHRPNNHSSKCLKWRVSLPCIRKDWDAGDKDSGLDRCPGGVIRDYNSIYCWCFASTL